MRKTIKLILFSISLLVLAVAVANLALSMVRLKPDETKGSIRIGPKDHDSDGSLARHSQQSGTFTPLVSIDVLRVSPQTRSLDARISVSFPKDFAESLAFSDSEKLAKHDPQRRTNEKDRLQLKLSIIDRLRLTESNILIPIETLFSETRGDDSYSRADYSMETSIPLYGESTPYPSDWYSATMYSMLKLPDQLYLKKGELGRVFALNPKMEISLTSAAEPFQCMVFAGQEGGQFDLTLERKFSFKCYIYSMALLPLLLGAAFACSFFGKNKAHSVSFNELMLGTGGFMMATIPLRSVLVPSEFGGYLSRADGLLAVAVALVASTALYAYFSLEKD